MTCSVRYYFIWESSDTTLYYVHVCMYYNVCIASAVPAVGAAEVAA